MPREKCKTCGAPVGKDGKHDATEALRLLKDNDRLRGDMSRMRSNLTKMQNKVKELEDELRSRR